jgi:CRP-like cAMP-binding protein
MDVQGNKLIDGSRAMPPTKFVASPPPNQNDDARLIDAICAYGDCMHLRPQQRVQLPPTEKLVILNEGLLAIDAMPEKGKLQILDFLVAGDLVTAPIVVRTPGVSLRAITSAVLVSIDRRAIDLDPLAHDYWAFLFTRCQNQLARSNIHQMMIGRLETEPRVASFLLAKVLADIRGRVPDLNVSLPMSRTDIANYLVINCDTLSRTMMKFCNLGLIARESRHVIRVLDIDELRKRSPLAPLLSAVFKSGDDQHGVCCGGRADRNTSAPSDHSNHAIFCRGVTTTSPLPCFNAQRLDVGRIRR